MFFLLIRRTSINVSRSNGFSTFVRAMSSVIFCNGFLSQRSFFSGDFSTTIFYFQTERKEQHFTPGKFTCMKLPEDKQDECGQTTLYEMSRNRLRVIEKLGEGNFGMVSAIPRPISPKNRSPRTSFVPLGEGEVDSPVPQSLSDPSRLVPRAVPAPPRRVPDARNVIGMRTMIYI